MANSINTNIAAAFAQANIAVAANAAASAVARLSSGNRIVQASDDVTALAIGTSLGTQVSALKTALTNASQGSSLLQVADGALAQIQSILQTLQSISNQAQSGSLTNTDRGFLDQQFQALSGQIDSLAASSSFNGVTLLDGSVAGSNPLQSAGDGGGTITGFSAQTGSVTAATFADAAGTGADITFYGDLSEGVFNVTTATSGFNVGYSLNGSVYTGVITAALATAGGSLVLSNGQGAITFTLADDTTADITQTNARAVALQAAFTASFSGATGFASRTVLTTDAADATGSAITASDTNATLVDGLTGSDVTISSAFFSGAHLPSISDFKAIGTFGIGTKFQVTIDGKTYSSGALTDATDIAGLGGAAAIITGDGNNAIRFFLDGDSSSNPSEFLKIDLSNVTNNIDVDNQEGVDRFIASLNDVFGRSGGGLTFQLGTTADSTVGVTIASATTSSLFAGVTQNVASALDAATASAAVKEALDTVTSIRSGIGALEAQFNFAAAALQSGVQNQSAAQSQLLDTDIASESTNFATQQVKLQAGISVLAQANQQLQALLKLIG